MKSEWKRIARKNGITEIAKKLREEIAELDTVLEDCDKCDFPLQCHYDALLSEVADVQACIDQLVHWHRLRKPLRAMMHYKAQRQLWRFHEDGQS